MKERPILFSGPMVRAILNGRKTQTRRVVKPQPTNLAGPNFDGLWSDTIAPVVRYFACPYGAQGNRLWVRETWGWSSFASMPPSKEYPQFLCYRTGDITENEHVTRWRPSIHMPRWASRITLEVKAVRVERLQAISESDAQVEGVEASTQVEMKDGSPCYSTPYQILWEQINGVGSWEQNPWVWVVEFTRL